LRLRQQEHILTRADDRFRKRTLILNQMLNSLPSPKKGLLAHELDAQVMVYDSTDDRIHLLDPTTGCVLDLLQKGDCSVESISVEVARRAGVQPNQDLVLLAIEELDQAGLLEREGTEQGSLTGVNRRELVRKLAAAGLAGVMIPAIATLAASRAYAAGSLTGGLACGGNGDCASGKCSDGGKNCTFKQCANDPCLPKDSPCTNGTGTDICDNHCCTNNCKASGKCA
jgi:hypothetical protein